MENNKLIALILLFSGIALFLYMNVKTKQDKQQTVREEQQITTEPTSSVSLPKPEMTIDEDKNYSAVIKTSVGDITLDLNAKDTPITVNNFVYLSREGFYDDTIFHRVIENFMIQGGAPNRDGSGNPGYMFDDEPFEGSYSRGIVAMANAGPNTNGSQFFIMHQDYELSPDYVIFGKVSKGLDVVDKIATAETKVNLVSGEKSVPVDPVVVKQVEITEE